MPGVGVIHNLLSFLNKCVHKKTKTISCGMDNCDGIITDRVVQLLEQLS